MYHAPNFSCEELLPPEVLQRFGSSGLRLMSPLLLITAQQLRNKFGRMLVNVPDQGLEDRGFRTSEFYEREENLSPEAAREKFARYYSMHKFGCALDITPLDTPLETILDYIKENPDEFPFLSFVEVDVSWLHIDVRNQPNITFWSPENGVVYVAEQQEINWSLLAHGV